MIVYLAGPIDGIKPEDAKEWRQEAVKELSANGIHSFDPSAPYGIPKGSCKTPFNETAFFIDMVNRTAINYCDWVLVNLSGPGMAVGTCREIEYARARNKPVLVINPDGLMRVGLYDVSEVDDLQRALECLIERYEEIQN